MARSVRNAVPLHGPPHLRRRERHVDVADTERLQRVDDGVHDGSAATDRRRLAHALHAERVVRRRRDRLAQLPRRALHRRRQEVVHERAAEAVAVLVEGDHLHERHADAVGQAAVHLTLDDHRVDARPAVVDGDEPPHLHLAGAGVDVDHADVGAERVGEVGRVVDARGRRGGPPRRRAARAVPWAPMAISWMVLPTDGSPFTNQRPFSHSRSSGEHSSMAAATMRALSRTRRAAIATAAPDTGVERSRRCRGRTACCRCRRGRPRCPPAGCRSPPTTIWAKVVSWPWPWVCTESRTTALPVGCTRSSAPSAMPRPEDVHVLARAGADCLGEEGEADAHELAARALLGLLPAQIVVAGHVQGELQRTRVVAGVVLPAGRASGRELLGPQQVLHAQLGRVHAFSSSARQSTMRSTR